MDLLDGGLSLDCVVLGRRFEREVCERLVVLLGRQGLLAWVLLIKHLYSCRLAAIIRNRVTHWCLQLRPCTLSFGVLATGPLILLERESHILKKVLKPILILGKFLRVA